MLKMIDFYQYLSGYRIQVSPYAYIEKVLIKGVPSKRKPNSFRPLYLKKKTKIPQIYVYGKYIICSPESKEKIERELEKRQNL